jgi:hypothetical protein
MLLALNDHALAAVARTLPLSAAVAVARSCRRLRLVFPRALGAARAAPVRLCARVTHESQAAAMLEWMRVYDLTLVVRSKDVTRLVGALAGRPRCARLELTRLCEYGAVYRHMRRRGLVGRLATPKSRYVWFGRGAVDEWDAEDVEFDRGSWMNARGRLARRVTDALVAHLGGVHTLDLTLQRVTDAGVAHLSNVHTLLLGGTEVGDAGVACLGGLHTLDLHRTRVTDAGVGALSGLHTLLLGHTDVGDAGVARLGGLHTLCLHRTRVTDAGVGALSGLHTLLLGHTDVGDAGVGPLSGLHALDLHGTRVTDAGRARLRNVRSLDVSGMIARCALDELRRLALS